MKASPLPTESIVETFKIDIHYDDRGSFREAFRDSSMLSRVTFRQVNVSISEPNVFRGLHFQYNPVNQNGQAKYLCVIKGTIIDYLVDIRVNSPDFGKVYEYNLSRNGDKSAIYIPVGFAHGFYVPDLFNEAIVLYLCSEEYNPSLERGLTYKHLNKVNIRQSVILSERDKNQSTLEELLQQGVLPQVELV